MDRMDHRSLSVVPHPGTGPDWRFLFGDNHDCVFRLPKSSKTAGVLLALFWKVDMRLRFDDCVFDSDTRELFRSDRPVHLSPKAFRMLELLLENRPRALSKQDLQTLLWPDTFVSEGNLATLASEIRRELGEKAGAHRPIRTVYSFGYAFSGEAVEEERPSPCPKRRCWLVWNKQEIPLARGENIIGRDPAARARIDDTTVSRHHARIVVTEEGERVEDLKSKNGTFVGARRIRKPVRLSDGDEIKTGSVFLTFRVSSPEQSTETARES